MTGSRLSSSRPLSLRPSGISQGRIHSGEPPPQYFDKQEYSTRTVETNVYLCIENILTLSGFCGGRVENIRARNTSTFLSPLTSFGVTLLGKQFDSSQKNKLVGKGGSSLELNVVCDSRRSVLETSLRVTNLKFPPVQEMKTISTLLGTVVQCPHRSPVR